MVPPTLREPESVTNKRQHERVEIAIPILLLYGEREIETQTRNVSAGGLLVNTVGELPFGASVQIRMMLPGGEVTVPATVRWVRGDAMGLQFGSLRAKETWAVHQLMKIGAKK
jgi:hypothetical protein